MFDIAIIGAGIVGLATAHQLLKKNPDLKIVILEKETQIAMHQTGRNSGVIHSGIYYPSGSLKLKNCLRGKKQLLSYAEENNIAIQKVGKVILATHPRDLPKLLEIEERGRANQIGPIERIGPERLKEIEPHAFCIQGLWIPDCSIISYLDVAQNLAKDLQNRGVQILLGEAVTHLISTSSEIKIQTINQEISASLLINCAGLFSDRLAKMALKKQIPFQIFPFRGEYYSLRAEKEHLVKGLIYPVPDPRFPFLGVHLTRRVDGTVEAGPNAVLAMGREAYLKGEKNWKDCLELVQFPGFWKMCSKFWKVGLYEMARSKAKTLFLKDLRTLMPCLNGEDLIVSDAGIRAQLVDAQGKLCDDFSIVQESRMIHVLNAPSPAATASFAIGEHIASLAIPSSPRQLENTLQAKC